MDDSTDALFNFLLLPEIKLFKKSSANAIFINIFPASFFGGFKFKDTLTLMKNFLNDQFSATNMNLSEKIFFFISVYMIFTTSFTHIKPVFPVG